MRTWIPVLMLAALTAGPGTGAARELHYLVAGEEHDSGTCQLCQDMVSGSAAVLQAGEQPAGPSEPTIYSPFNGAQTCAPLHIPLALLPRGPPSN